MLRRLGVLLVVAGLAIGGYVAWQVWGTTWQSERRHASLVEEVEEQWAKPDKGRTITTEYGDVSAIVRIPAFGDDYAVPLLEGITDEALAAGFGRFPDSARAGATGNFALAAHRVTHGEPLRDMPALEPGDEIMVETARATYTYVLDTGGGELEVPFTAGWVLDAVPENPDAGGVQPPPDAGERLITLTTCSELFHTDDRLVAFGHLVDKDPR
jgi:sortase A